MAPFRHHLLVCTQDKPDGTGYAMAMPFSLIMLVGTKNGSALASVDVSVVDSEGV